MKKNFLALEIFAFVFTFGLVACGDDSSSNSEPNDIKGESISLADGSGEKLCDEKLEGWVAEATGKDFRRCQNGEWIKITANEASAEEEIIGGVTVLQSSSSIMEESSSSIKDSGSVEDSSSSNVIASEAKQSSSSVIVSSSSAPTENLGSSSSSLKVDLPPDVSHGTMTDSRDDHVYKTVTIGTQTWMAENLNYDYNKGTARSYCYGCTKYGRLYLWSAAMDSAGAFSTAGKDCGYGKTCNAKEPVRGVCPEGWHLPSDDEWNLLWSAIGGTSSAGTKLKSASGWFNDGNGIDSFGFAVLPAGYRDNFGYYNDEGAYAYFWSSSENDGYYAYHWYFGYDRDHVRRYNYDKNYFFSVRCLRGSEDEENGTTLLSSSSAISAPDLGSSSSADKPNWRYLNPNIDYGEFTDVRDNQIYKTVKIGSQTWMAENLNYTPYDVSSMGENAWSGCYDNESANCNLYGRLYTWDVAMDNADCAEGKGCNPDGIVQGVCPSGWHLPTKKEWQELLELVTTGIVYEPYYQGAGDALKAVVDKWKGTDTFGFSALPGGGSTNSDDNFDGANSSALFWSSGENGSNEAYGLFLSISYTFAHFDLRNKTHAFSVRCVWDE